MTRTYALMPVSRAAFEEIKASLVGAGYEHAIDGDRLDMHGIAVTPEEKSMHPNTAAILKFFAFDHLPPKLREISEPFAALASAMAEKLDGPELTAGLRKVLEAKDCFVRAAL